MFSSFLIKIISLYTYNLFKKTLNNGSLEKYLDNFFFLFNNGFVENRVFAMETINDSLSEPIQNKITIGNKSKFSESMSPQSYKSYNRPKTCEIERKKLFLSCLPNIFYCFYQKLLNCLNIKNNKTRKATKIEPQEMDTSSKNAQKFLRFIKVLMIVLKYVRVFKWRTKFRKIDFITPREISFINDQAYDRPKETTEKKISFIRIKFIRIKILALKRKFKKIWKLFGNEN